MTPALALKLQPRTGPAHHGDNHSSYVMMSRQAWLWLCVCVCECMGVSRVRAYSGCTRRFGITAHVDQPMVTIRETQHIGKRSLANHPPHRYGIMVPT